MIEHLVKTSASFFQAKLVFRYSSLYTLI